MFAGCALSHHLENNGAKGMMNKRIQGENRCWNFGI
jgi:hypothetical protein